MVCPLALSFDELLIIVGTNQRWPILSNPLSNHHIISDLERVGRGRIGANAKINSDTYKGGLFLGSRFRDEFATRSDDLETDGMANSYTPSRNPSAQGFNFNSIRLDPHVRSHSPTPNLRKSPDESRSKSQVAKRTRRGIIDVGCLDIPVCAIRFRLRG